MGVTNLAGSILPAVDTANDVYAVPLPGLGTVVGRATPSWSTGRT